MKLPVILCVDDDQDILNSIEEQLSNHFENEFDIETAEDGDEAIHLIQQFHEKGLQLPLIIVDYIMPKTYGNKVIEKLKDLYPASLAILLTGQAKLTDIEGIINKTGLNKYISKPWKARNLYRAVRDSVDLYNKEKLIVENKDKLENINKSLEKEIDDRTRELKESEEKYRLLVELSPDGIVLHKDNKFLYINDSGLKMLGIECKEDILNQSVNPFIHPESKYFLQNITVESLTNKNNVIEEKLITSNGSIIDIELFAISINNNNQLAILTIFRDISERKRVQSLKENTEKMMRHDLKNPINSIIGIAEILLQKRKIEQKQRKYIKAIRNSGAAVLNMIDSSINLYKMEEGIYEIVAEEVNLNNLFMDLEIRFKSLLQMKNMNIEFYYADKPLNFKNDLIIFSERVNLETLFSNLIKNAIEATPKGVNISVRILDKNSNYQFIIHNKGMIEESIQSRFFDRYATYGKVGGTGLGTYTAKLIVDTYGGEISFSTDVVDGTDLIIFLPKTIEQENEIQLEPNPVLKNVLVIDDQEENHDIITELLSGYNINIHSAYNGNEALKLLSECDDYIFVLLDIHLPIQSGFKVFEKIKMDDAIRDDLIIYGFTSDNSYENISKIKSVGMHGFLSKPLNINKFIELVNSFI